jgi:hypothetical protein
MALPPLQKFQSLESREGQAWGRNVPGGGKGPRKLGLGDVLRPLPFLWSWDCLKGPPPRTKFPSLPWGLGRPRIGPYYPLSVDLGWPQVAHRTSDKGVPHISCLEQGAWPTRKNFEPRPTICPWSGQNPLRHESPGGL